jgi:alpha-glucosidase
MDEAWWQGAVIYQIYPRSFQDTTGNGIGDLPGITRRLDHVASLGADAIWISPFCASPQKDYGYDVSDYEAVDPMFGDLDDFRRLLDAAHERGLKVIMDQVLSHSSDRHPWFLESRESRDNPKADWYVWADPRPDGTPPNNWLAIFGGPSWQWEPRRRQYYLHNFLREQPDLNFWNAEMQDALLEMCRFWLELGVDGFRLDVCAFYFHDRELRDNPPVEAPPEGEGMFDAGFNPYGMQSHIHDIERPETLGFIERLRALCDGYEGRVLLGELHGGTLEPLHPHYTAPKRLQLAYSFWLLGRTHIGAGTLRDLAEELGYAPGDGWPCWAIDNHDFTRAVTRLGAEERPEAVTVLYAALASMRGATCLWEGAELGLPEAEIPHERILDPYGREFWPDYKGRDGTRTPMPWEADAHQAGFSDAAETWLPIPQAHRRRAVSVQEREPDSTLSRMRTFLNWRKGRAPLRRGTMAFLDAPEPMLALARELDGEEIVCLFNLGADEVRLPAPEGQAAEGHGFAGRIEDGEAVLPGFEALFLVR